MKTIVGGGETCLYLKKQQQQKTEGERERRIHD